jgi:hypothetical protein
VAAEADMTACATQRKSKSVHGFIAEPRRGLADQMRGRSA